MRLNIHDFSGHPFQVQLSRELAGRGHFVVHGFSPQFVTGRGRLELEPTDPENLRIEGITCSRPGHIARATAEQDFEIDRIADSFERILYNALETVAPTHRSPLAVAGLSTVGRP